MKTKPKSDPGFRLEAKGDAVELDIYDVIGSGWFGGVSAKSVVDALKPHKNAKAITVNLNSPGGDAFDGISIYNVLSRHKAPVTVNIDGLAASAASVIAMAGDEIHMAENAMLMIHNAWGLAIGGGSDMRHTADMLDKLDTQIVATYAARTGGDPDTIREQMADETWFTADEAMADGFATSVTPAKKMAAHFNPEIFNQFKHAPDQLREAFFHSPAVETVETPENEVTDMEDITPEAFASQNPDAVKNWQAEGAVQADADHKARCEALKSAFPDDPAFALDQVIAGHDVPKAKAEYADILADKNKRLAAENAELKKQKSDDEDGADPVNLAASDTPKDKYAGLSVHDRIQAEWDDDLDGCQKKYHTLQAYAGYRQSRLTA